MENKQESKKETKWWQPLIAVATVIIAGVGAWATSIYNARQAQLQEMETVQKFFPYLVSDDPRLNAMARHSIKRVLRDKQLAQALIQDSVKIITEREATASPITSPSSRPVESFPQLKAKIMEPLTEKSTKSARKDMLKARPKAAKPDIKKVESEGWAYLGDFSNNEWQTRYFDFPDTQDPNQLAGKTINVREQTGSLNVRLGMPTPGGEFPQIINVLRVGMTVTVKEVKNWQSTGYMWAKITYRE